MADAASTPAPVARSSIAPARPVAVEQGWEVSARRSDAALRITDCSPLTKVLVKAPAGGRAAAGPDVPFGRTVRDGDGILIVGSGPGEWLLVGPPGTASDVLGRAGTPVATAADPGAGDSEHPGTEIGDGGDPALVATFDVTHARALLRVTGAAAADMLAKVCAVDLGDAVSPDGAAFRTSVAAVVTDVVRDDRDGQPSYLLGCDRSFGQYLFDALLDAGAELAIDVDGFRPPGI